MAVLPGKTWTITRTMPACPGKKRDRSGAMLQVHLSVKAVAPGEGGLGTAETLAALQPHITQLSFVLGPSQPPSAVSVRTLHPATAFLLDRSPPCNSSQQASD